MRILQFTSLIALTQLLSANLTAEGVFIETIGKVSFVMKEIPSGDFTMGYPSTEKFLISSESADLLSQNSQRTEAVESFFMAETETTWALYQLCIDEGACPDNREDGGDNGWGKDERPAIEVSWDDITDHFIPWLNAKTGKTYRLPTEIEWEYAARAGSTTRYNWGDEIDHTQARYGYLPERHEERIGTVPVKSHAPNAFGLYDMHGNVWEWVSDCWNDSTMQPIVPRENTKACREFVLRGGSWLNQGDELHSAFRARHDRTFRESGDGFRLALSK